MSEAQPYRDEYADNARRVSVLEAELRALRTNQQEANRAGNPSHADSFQGAINERCDELRRRKERI